MKRVAFVLVVAGCGGKARSMPPSNNPPAPVPPASACDLTARHMTDAVFAWKEPPPTSKENVFGVLRSHCNDDKWSADAMECFGKITDEASSMPCAEKLTKDQLDKVMGAMYAKFDDSKNKGSPVPAGSPAPSGADPCEGGE